MYICNLFFIYIGLSLHWFVIQLNGECVIKIRQTTGEHPCDFVSDNVEGGSREDGQTPALLNTARVILKGVKLYLMFPNGTSLTNIPVKKLFSQNTYVGAILCQRAKLEERNYTDE